VEFVDENIMCIMHKMQHLDLDVASNSILSFIYSEVIYINTCTLVLCCVSCQSFCQSVEVFSLFSLFGRINTYILHLYSSLPHLFFLFLLFQQTTFLSFHFSGMNTNYCNNKNKISNDENSTTSSHEN